MSPRRLLALFAPALIIAVEIAAFTQAREAITDMVAAKLSEIIIAKIQTSRTNFNLRTPASAELNNPAAMRGS